MKRGVAAARRRATTAAQRTDLSEIENGIQGLVHVVAAGFDIRDFDENSAVNSNLHVVLRDRVLLWDLRGAAQIKTKTRGSARRARKYRSLVLPQTSDVGDFFDARGNKVAAGVQFADEFAESLQDVCLALRNNDASAAEQAASERVTHWQVLLSATTVCS